MRRRTQKLSVAGALGLAVLLTLLGCSSASAHSPHSYSPPKASGSSYGGGYAADDADMIYLAESAPAARGEQRARPQSAADRHAVVDSSPSPGQQAQPDATPPEVDEEPTRGQLLIYTGALVLAIYDVEQTQDKVVALVEEMEGYISKRSSNALTARVPAPKFRSAMEDIGALGDVLDRSWDAQDVSDEVRDLDIRLRNARGLRDRLEALLDDVETIEEALQIERELERITLEIERIRGQLQSFENRIAYSTIQINFRSRRVDDVPDDEFLLPFRWLNTLGLQSLLRAPEVYR